MRSSRFLGVVAAPVIALMIGAGVGVAAVSEHGAASQHGANKNGSSQDAWSKGHTDQKNLSFPISADHGKDGKYGSKDGRDNGGFASQDNAADTNSNANNDNQTKQSLNQQQLKAVQNFFEKFRKDMGDWKDGGNGWSDGYNGNGSGSSGDVSQYGNNSNWTDQSAWSDATTKQANINAGIGFGASGDVNQSNDAQTKSNASNDNATHQKLNQQQAVISQDFGKDGKKFSPKSSHGDVSQAGSNDNYTSQDANSKAKTDQANIYAPITLWSKDGHGADVNQSNSADTKSNASNNNWTDQYLNQDQAVIGQGGHPSSGDVSQYGKNSNGTDQSAASQAKTEQVNIYAPITLWGGSPGNVSQSNTAHTNSSANNSNGTVQGQNQSQAAVSSSY
jgi:hypothetical protein